MKYFVIVILLFATIHVQAQVKALQDAEQQRYALMIAGDTTALSTMLAPSLIYYHSNGMADTKQSFLQSIATKTLVHKNITVEEQTTRKYGRKMGVVTGKCTYYINYNGEDMTLHFVFTNMYYKFKGKWLLVSRQTTKDSFAK